MDIGQWKTSLCIVYCRRRVALTSASDKSDDVMDGEGEKWTSGEVSFKVNAIE